MEAVDELFYIVSIKWSCLDESALVFWCADAKGYTDILGNAGKYTKSEIDAHPAYYNNGTDTMAIPIAEVEAQAHVMVKNDSYQRQALGLPKAKKRGQ